MPPVRDRRLASRSETEEYAVLLAYLNEAPDDILSRFLSRSLVYTANRFGQDDKLTAALRDAARATRESWRSVLSELLSRLVVGGPEATTSVTAQIAPKTLEDLYPPEHRWEAGCLSLELCADAFRHGYALCPLDLREFEELFVEGFCFRPDPVGGFTVDSARAGRLTEILRAAQQLRRLIYSDRLLAQLRECRGCRQFYFDYSPGQHGRYCRSAACRRLRDRYRQASFRTRRRMKGHVG